jgi:1,2-diacylglycerol 3-alpha-glucosyltransferase
MKIGLFTDTYLPQINGVATSVFMHKENLEKLGHQVFVFTTTDPKAPLNETGVFRISSIPFASSRRIGIFIPPSLSRFIKGLGLDMVHTHTEFSLGIIGRSIARDLKIPFIHTYHTIYENYTHYIVKRLGVLEPAAKKLARTISTSFCNSANSVITPTDKVRDLLLSYSVRNNISVIPTGIDTNRFNKSKHSPESLLELRASLGIGIQDKLLLYIGRMSKEKNIEELLTYLREYLLSQSNVKLLLVGDGPDKRRLVDLAKETGIHNHTIFAGEVPWDNIGAYYQLGELFVSASQSETQGITYMEALASGLPVVARADRCLEGVIQNKVNGFVFYDQAELTGYVDLILHNSEAREQLSRGAVHSIHDLSGVHFAKSIEAAYERLLAKAYLPLYAAGERS